MTLNEQKANAKAAYIAAKKQYLQNMTKENWIKFCDAEILCAHLGVIV